MSMFDKQERAIRRVLRQLARQRLAMVLQPGNAWVIETSVSRDDESNNALLTCYLRGWAEPLDQAVPFGEVPLDGRFADDKPIFTQMAQMYRLTDSGWAVVNRAQLWILTGVFVGIVSLLVTVITILATHPK